MDLFALLLLRPILRFITRLISKALFYGAMVAIAYLAFRVYVGRG